MYSFRQRLDTTVVDEPLYAHYLAHTGLHHPGRDDVLAAQSNDAVTVLDDVLLADPGTPVLVAKQMAHHLRGLPHAVVGQLDRRFRHVLLVRDPSLVLRSYARAVERPSLDDLGYRELVRLLDTTIASGGDPVVVDATRLRTDPARVLEEVCRRVELPWDPAMLEWPAGPKPEDGVWAPHWYAGVHRSTSFAPPGQPPTEPLPVHLAAVAAEAQPLYDHLLRHAI